MRICVETCMLVTTTIPLDAGPRVLAWVFVVQDCPNPASDLACLSKTTSARRPIHPSVWGSSFLREHAKRAGPSQARSHQPNHAQHTQSPCKMRKAPSQHALPWGGRSSPPLIATFALDHGERPGRGVILAESPRSRLGLSGRFRSWRRGECDAGPEPAEHAGGQQAEHDAIDDAGHHGSPGRVEPDVLRD